MRYFSFQARRGAAESTIHGRPFGPAGLRVPHFLPEKRDVEGSVLVQRRFAHAEESEKYILILCWVGLPFRIGLSCNLGKRVACAPPTFGISHQNTAFNKSGDVAQRRVV